MTLQKINEATKLISTIIAALGVIALLFLESEYATKEEVQGIKEDQQAEVEQIKRDQQATNTAIKVMIEHNKTNAVQDKRIESLSSRVLELEKNVARIQGKN